MEVLICANNFMARVELEDPGRGGEARGEGSIEFDAHGEKGWKAITTGHWRQCLSLINNKKHEPDGWDHSLRGQN